MPVTQIAPYTARLLCSLWLLIAVATATQATAGTVRGKLEDGSRYVAERSGGAYNGAIRIEHPNGDITEGTMSNDLWHGIAVTQFAVTGLKVMTVYEHGEVIDSYSELDADMATGDYDAVYRKRGKAPYLGIRFRETEPFGKKRQITIDHVSLHSTAAIAGLRAGDIIEAMDGKKPASLLSMVQRIQKVPYGKNVTLSVVRSGTGTRVDVMPFMVPAKGGKAGLTPTLQQLWQSTAATGSRRKVRQYLENIQDTRFHSEAQALLARLDENEPGAFKAALETATVEGYSRFLYNYGDGTHAAEIRQRLVALREASSEPHTVYQTYRNLCHDCASLFPAEDELLASGPIELRVADILQLQNNVDPELLAMKIEGSGLVYADYDLDQAQLLYSVGIARPVVNAMIKSTQGARKTASATPGFGEIAGSALAEQALSQGLSSDCVKLAAGLKACEHTGTFGAIACKALVRNKFQCPVAVEELMAQ